MEDIIIVGTGAAGLYAALNLPEDKNILMITKDEIEKSDSFLAQGGICVLKDSGDYESFFNDTMKAGHYENNKESVEVMIRSSVDIMNDLMEYGVEFEKENGELIYTREGAHSTERILYHKDITGKEITSKLISEVKKRDNIKILEHTAMIDIISKNNRCQGVVICSRNGQVSAKKAEYVILATGGIGGLYEHSTNYRHLTGDALAIAIKHGIRLKDINYIQIHPTTFYSKKTGRRFLISESVRGEGAVLLNKNGERFTNELLPRDLLTAEIKKQMKIDKQDYVMLSMVHLGSEKIKKRFPNIYQYCLEEGYDITRESIPVTPAQHYFMGGIRVDIHSKTSMEHLYAVGETSCNGVHGANRLASNSLLESLVFAKRSALHITEYYENLNIDDCDINLKEYKNMDKLMKTYRKTLLDEIERTSNDKYKCG